MRGLRVCLVLLTMLATSYVCYASTDAECLPLKPDGVSDFEACQACMSPDATVQCAWCNDTMTCVGVVLENGQYSAVCTDGNLLINRNECDPAYVPEEEDNSEWAQTKRFFEKYQLIVILVSLGFLLLCCCCCFLQCCRKKNKKKVGGAKKDDKKDDKKAKAKDKGKGKNKTKDALKGIVADAPAPAALDVDDVVLTDLTSQQMMATINAGDSDDSSDLI